MLLTLAVFLLLSVQRCHAVRDGFRLARITHLEAQGYAAARASLQRRRTTDSIAALSITQANIVKQQSSRLTILGRQLDAVLAANDSLLSDSLTLGTDTLSQRLIAALARTTEVARLYHDSTDALLGSVERLLASQSDERTAWLAERQAHRADVASRDALISVLKTTRDCRVLFIPCPSRRTAFAAGVVATLGVIVAVAR